MVTPRRTRLTRTATLRHLHGAIADLIRASDDTSSRETLVLVPTRVAATQLERTLRRRSIAIGPAPRRVPVRLLTRDEWYHVLASDLAGEPLLSDVERYVRMLAAARTADRAGAPPPFEVRPGLVPAIIGFYDDLMRNQQSVDSFERLTVSDLEPSVALDRGARRLLRQTRFLVAAFRAYELQLVESHRMDEHRLRRSLLEREYPSRASRIVVTVADRAAEIDGLWPADFDLLTRLAGLEQVDVVATEATLDSGFYERVTELLPGIEEARWDEAAGPSPTLVAPGGRDDAHFVWRDREDELLGALHAIGAESRPSENDAVVFQRPLPYLYLARHLLDGAEDLCESGDELPLAAEPYAAAVDLVATVVISGYSRTAVIQLLSSPHFTFRTETGPLDGEAVEALDRALHEVRFAGGRTQLATLAEGWSRVAPGRDARGQGRARAADAAAVAAALADELRGLEAPGPSSAHLETLVDFLTRHQRSDVAPAGERTASARQRILEGLSALAQAHRAVDDSSVDFADLMASVRRWIETQTTPPEATGSGIQLLDTRAARYSDLRRVFIVGLVDDEWPERPPRSIFYPSPVLAALGWPRDRERRAAARARFHDLLELARERVAVSTFTLEDDAVVTPSVFLEHLDEVGLAVVREPAGAPDTLLQEHLLARATRGPGEWPEPVSSWLALRQRKPRGSSRFRGYAGGSRVDVHSVSALERYADCPFKYFARHELRLPEEPADELTLTPRDRGLMLHRLLETFFTAWQADGEGAITLATLDRAVGRFRRLVDQELRRVSPGDRAVLRVWLLGSAASPGLLEQLCILEIEQPVDVVERMVELRVDGLFTFHADREEHAARVRGVVDRVDLLADGGFRVIDYKTSRAPRRDRALQLPVYVRCVEQQLDGHRGRSWRPREAAYLAFGDARVHTPLTRERLEEALADGEARAVGVLAQIDRGVFPPRPAEPHRCDACPYVTVCRKDYVDDQDVG